MNVQELKELGLSAAADKVQGKINLQKKLMIAYEHYRFVEPHIFHRFADELKTKTQKVQSACPKCHNVPIVKMGCNYCQKTGAMSMTYDKLAFIPLAKYTEVPPAEVLVKLREAKERQCFDRFEVAKIETVEVRPDPIIFGIIEGCNDKFEIAQWGEDVKIEDILRENEG